MTNALKFLVVLAAIVVSGAVAKTGVEMYFTSVQLQQDRVNLILENERIALQTKWQKNRCEPQAPKMQYPIWIGQDVMNHGSGKHIGPVPEIL